LRKKKSSSLSDAGESVKQGGLGRTRKKGYFRVPSQNGRDRKNAINPAKKKGEELFGRYQGCAHGKKMEGWQAMKRITRKRKKMTKKKTRKCKSTSPRGGEFPYQHELCRRDRGGGSRPAPNSLKARQQKPRS